MTKKYAPPRLRMLPGGQLIAPDAPLPPVSVGELPLEPWMAMADWVAQCSDAELAEMLAKHLLPMTQIWTWAHTMLSEAIDRLEGRSLAPPP